MVVAVSNSILSSKIDSGKANTQIYSQHINSSYTQAGTHDNFGREGLCQNSLFSLYPGKSDCIFQGLISNETNMRPAYWRHIGDCDGNDAGYVGGKDQMILGYGSGPRGYVANVDKQALENVSCGSLPCGAAKEACMTNRAANQTQKYNFTTTNRSLATCG